MRLEFFSSIFSDLDWTFQTPKNLPKSLYLFVEETLFGMAIFFDWLDGSKSKFFLKDSKAGSTKFFLFQML